MNEEKIYKYLKEPNKRNNSPEEQNKFTELLKDLKQKFVKENNQKQAKRIWCLEQIFSIQNVYLLAYEYMKSHKFYNAWVKFGQIEIKLSNLKRHYKEKDNRFYLQHISEYTKKFQSLYPYKFFFSTEEIISEKECSICGKKISLRNHCGHEVGEIYNGEMCYRIINRIDALTGVSLVNSPSRKYAVAFLKTKNGLDSYNYSPLKYLIRYLESPFEKWDYEWTTTRHPHEFFSDVKPEDKCPCDSGKKYIDCCMSEEGILRPHCQFFFYEEKLKEFDFEYSY